MNVHIARQPIFRKNLSVYAYELLYRNNGTTNAFDPTKSGDAASSSVLLDAFGSIGLENLIGKRKAFVNFTEDLIAMEVATLFPPDQLVVEILETVSPLADIVEKCTSLKAAGYAIALDDFVFTPEYLPLVGIADIIKIDFRQTPPDKIAKYIALTRQRNIMYLAEKVETREEFDLAAELGFELFQGYFLSKPVIVSGQRLPPLPANYFRLLKLINSSEFDLDEIQTIIVNDISLSYDVLKLVNSVAFGFRQRIRTIQHALVALGMAGVRKWVSLVVLSGINREQPIELIKSSLIRANFLQNIGVDAKKDAETTESMFMLGLFSMMNVILDRSFPVLFHEIRVPAAVEACLAGETGELYDYYALMLAYERGNWDAVSELTFTLGLVPDRIAETYLSALRTCEQIFGKD